MPKGAVVHSLFVGGGARQCLMPDPTAHGASSGRPKSGSKDFQKENIRKVAELAQRKADERQITLFVHALGMRCPELTFCAVAPGRERRCRTPMLRTDLKCRRGGIMRIIILPRPSQTTQSFQVAIAITRCTCYKVSMTD
eukprot:2513862-Rhodomonas_salina.2